MYVRLEEVQNRIQFSCTNNAHGIQEYVAGYVSEMTSNTERRQCTSSCVYDATWVGLVRGTKARPKAATRWLLEESESTS